MFRHSIWNVSVAEPPDFAPPVRASATTFLGFGALLGLGLAMNSDGRWGVRVLDTEIRSDKLAALYYGAKTPIVPVGHDKGAASRDAAPRAASATKVT